MGVSFLLELSYILIFLWKFYVICNLDGFYSYLKFFVNINLLKLKSTYASLIVTLNKSSAELKKIIYNKFLTTVFSKLLGIDVKLITISNSTTETWINYHMVQYLFHIYCTWLLFFVADWIIDYFIFYLPFIARKSLLLNLRNFCSQSQQGDKNERQEL